MMVVERHAEVDRETEPKAESKPAKKAEREAEQATVLDDKERIARVKALTQMDIEEGLVLSALTHRAFCNDHPEDGVANYERLEFLGDAVLDLVTAEILLRSYPDADEGELTQRRAAYVSEPALAAAAARSGLDQLVRLSRAQTMVGDDRLPSICADVVESVLGASFMTGGLSAAKDVCLRILGSPSSELATIKQDEKTALQERIQALFGLVPRYEIARADGPDHAPVFEARVFVGAHELGGAQGLSKKTAAQAAAKLANLEVGDLDDDALRLRLKS